MKIKAFVIAAALAASTPIYAGGLSAAVLACDEQRGALSIGGDIATAVVRSLLGTAIDAIVTYLDDPRAKTFEVILPVESIDALVSGSTQCLYLSSGRLDDLTRPSEPNVWSDPREIPATFFAKIMFVAPKGAGPTSPLRPVVLRWKYAGFLEPNCPFLRDCSRRDVAMSLAFMAPASSVAGRTVSSEPLGFAIVNATASDVEAAVPVRADGQGAALPWFLRGDVQGPINIRFTIVETSQPNKFTKALAAAIAAQKTAIQDTVENKLKGISDQVAAEAAQKDVAAASKAFDDYKKAYDTAYTTKLAYDASADSAQRKVLSAQYLVQREAARLSAVLGEAAFKVAGLTWPSGGLGPLPDL